MTIAQILEQLKTVRGTNAKKEILKSYKDNILLRKVLRYSLDVLMPFHIVKVPKVKDSERNVVLDEAHRWDSFFQTADQCASRKLSGHAAIDKMHSTFAGVTLEEEAWMRKVLKKHLSIGASVKTVNSVMAGLIPLFELSLAQKFNEKRIKAWREDIIVEPKLDGIRCFAIVRNGNVQMFSRSGKMFSSVKSTMIKDLVKLGDGCYDGELMGNDFLAIMRQAYRKEPDMEGVYYALFDYIPLEEWDTSEFKMSCFDRHEELLDKMMYAEISFKDVVPVERFFVRQIDDEIMSIHNDFVTEGYEGAMIKNPDAPYRPGRSYDVMKLKAFHDVDLEITGFAEGTGRHVGKLGAVTVCYKGVDVQVGSGFSDELREQIWNDQGSFVGRMIEIRYQEITPDGSLRFPTFVCFRNDRK